MVPTPPRAAGPRRFRHVACWGPTSPARPPRPARRLPFRPSRLDLLVVLVVALALFTLVAVTGRLVEHDRARLYQVYATDRQRALDEAAARVEEGLQDVAEDLAFGAGMVASTEEEGQRREVLYALVGSVRAYRGAVITDREGAPLLAVTDPRRKGPDADQLAAMARDVARQAQRPGARVVEASLDAPAEGGGLLRVFATRLPDSPVDAGRCLALVVDTAPLLSPLTILAAENLTWLVIVGPHGRIVPLSSPQATSFDAVVERGAAPTLGAILEELRSGGAGMRALPQEEAMALGLGEGEDLATWRAIAPQGVQPWGVATLSSVAPLRSHERSLILRLGGASALAGLLVAGFGAYSAVALRRSSELAARLGHAAALARANERAQRVVSSIPLSVLIVRPEGDVVEANPAWLRQFGPPPPGAGLPAALPEADPAALDLLRGLVSRAAAGAEPVQVDETLLRLQQTSGRYALHALPLGGPSPDVALVLDDRSELAALRTRLVRSEKLSTVGALAAGIAHEIGTPLSVIRGRAEYILGKLGPDHPQAEGLRVIVEQIERVVRTIRALLDFSRGQPAAAVATDLGQVVDRVLALLRLEAERRGLRLETRRPDPAPEVTADPDQLEQVLVNLLMNALDASAPGGRVVLGVAAAHAGFVEIEVIDHGVGIPPDELHRVFDPFFTTKKRGQGTGLGLTTVLQIARAHGAQVELDSAVGRGTRAILRWPGRT